MSVPVLGVKPVSSGTHTVVVVLIWFVSLRVSKQLPNFTIVTLIWSQSVPVPAIVSIKVPHAEMAQLALYTVSLTSGITVRFSSVYVGHKAPFDT